MFCNYTTLHGLSIRLSTSLSMVKTTMIRFSLGVFPLSPAMHLVPVYDVLLYVCECMCMLCLIIIIASMFRRTGQLLKLESVPASASKGWPSTGIHFDFRLWDYQKTPECMATLVVLTKNNLVP